jgi:Na+-driven multidrug efflux pump
MTKTLNKRHSRYEMDMCNGNLFFKIIIFSLPIMAMGFLQLFYNAADLLVVTNFSTNKDALGAVGSTSSLINLTVNLFMGLSVGANVVCAKLFGAGEKDKISKVVHTSILSSFIIGVFLMIFGFFYSKDLLALMNNDSEYSVLYLKIYFLGMPFNLVYNFAASILRAVGDTKRPLYYLSIAGAVNVVLNLFFVVVLSLQYLFF